MPKINIAPKSPKPAKPAKTPKDASAAVALRGEASIINRYLLRKSKPVKPSTNGRRASIQERLDAINAQLTKGTKEWNVPVGPTAKGGTRTSAVKELPLRPTEKARLLEKKAYLEARLAGGGTSRKSSTKGAELRAEFLKVLPVWARRHDYSNAMLYAIGVTAEDLVAAGMASTSTVSGSTSPETDPEVE